MPYVKNNIYKDLVNESKNGNAKAKRILQALRNSEKQSVIDDLLKDYYNLQVESKEEPKKDDSELERVNQLFDEPKEKPEDKLEKERVNQLFDEELKEEQNIEKKVEDTKEEKNNEEVKEEVKEEIQDEVQDEPVNDKEPLEEPLQEEPTEPVEEQEVDYTEILDKETDGLFYENEIPQSDLADYIKTKKRNAIRNSRGADYFKGFDPVGRERYIETKKKAYSDKFGDTLSDIERQYNDYSNSLANHRERIGLGDDDEYELSIDLSNNAYNDLTNDEPTMRIFNRYWDENDQAKVSDVLNGLVAKYGKQNVISALDILKSDVDGYKAYRNGQINEEIDRYGKGIEKILK